MYIAKIRILENRYTYICISSKNRYIICISIYIYMYIDFSNSKLDFPKFQIFLGKLTFKNDKNKHRNYQLVLCSIPLPPWVSDLSRTGQSMSPGGIWFPLYFLITRKKIHILKQYF